LRVDLETGLNQFSYQLKPFTEEEQRLCLENLWRKELCVSDDKAHLLKLYVHKLLRKILQTITDFKKELTGVPLQIQLIAGAFQTNSGRFDWEGCQEFVNSDPADNHPPRLPARIELTDLYSYFVKRKYYNIYCEGKKKEDLTNLAVEEDEQVLFAKFEREHILLALITLLSKEDIEYLQLNIEEIDMLMEKVHLGKERRGVVDLIIGSKPHFIHLTFAEYFIADYIAKEISSNPLINKLMLDKILTNSEFRVVRAFLDSLLSKVDLKEEGSHPPPALATCGRMTLDLWRSGAYKNNLKENQGKSPLHIAAAELNGSIIKSMVWQLTAEERRELLDGKDDTDKSPLRISLRNIDLKTFELLCELGADINLKDRLGETCLSTAVGMCMLPGTDTIQLVLM